MLACAGHYGKRFAGIETDGRVRLGSRTPEIPDGLRALNADPEWDSDGPGADGAGLDYR
jgi:hypothetical protein